VYIVRLCNLLSGLKLLRILEIIAVQWVNFATFYDFIYCTGLICHLFIFVISHVYNSLLITAILFSLSNIIKGKISNRLFFDKYTFLRKSGEEKGTESPIIGQFVNLF
jgi:hypothetical protein